MKKIYMIVALAGALVTNAFAQSADEVIKKSGITGGLIVHLNCNEGELIAALGKDKRFTVQGLDSKSIDVENARNTARTHKVNGWVTADQYDGQKLPYVDNLVNLIVEQKGAAPMDEIMRVLQPLGVALIDGKKMVKPWPDTMNEWTHYLGKADNNAVAEDENAGAPRHMQYVSGPRWTRHHDKLASMNTIVTAQGRIFSIADEGPV